MSNTKVIFGDEPTGALNSKAAQEIMQIFSEINGDGTTVILVTHDATVAAWSQRIMYMVDGKIISEIRLSEYSGKDMDSRVKRVTEKMREIGI